jgi:hypothetical protein
MDALDDVKMAVEEACQSLMQYARRERLHISFSREADAAVFCLSAEGEASEAEPFDERELDVIRAILLTMVDEVEISVDKKEPRAIRMVKMLPDE